MQAWARQKETGFTIVELLIVIVVIAILAAISIVAYSGIQQRADLAAAQSMVTQATKRLALFKVDNDPSYPISVNDCPTPAATNICLNLASGSYLYKALPQGGAGYLNVVEPSYEFASLGTRQFFYSSPAEIHGSNEFMQYTDMAPYIDKYGLVKYQIDFDIKSADTTNKNIVNVYMQNGSDSKYSFSQNVTVTTSYTHQTIIVTPAVKNASLAQSMLAFYGTYSTGNIPTVKNVQIKLAP